MEESNKHTSGLSIICIEGRTTIPAGETVKVFDSVLSDNLKRDEVFQHWRGQIINNALFIEDSVDLLIVKLLFGEITEKAVLFKTTIMSRESFGFMNKWKVLRDLLSSVSPFKDRDYTELKKDIHNIINERDKFAHGQVSYSGIKGEQIFLTYFNQSLRKEEITELSIKKFFELRTKCLEEIDKILAEMGAIKNDAYS